MAELTSEAQLNGLADDDTELVLRRTVIFAPILSLLRVIYSERSICLCDPVVGQGVDVSGSEPIVHVFLFIPLVYRRRIAVGHASDRHVIQLTPT